LVVFVFFDNYFFRGKRERERWLKHLEFDDIDIKIIEKNDGAS